MTWKDAFKKGNEIILATCSEDAKPNANIVISLGFVNGKLLIGDSQMNTTLKNLQKTKKICVVSKHNNKHYRLKGSIEIYSSGKYFDICSEATDKQHPTKNAILVQVEEVFDLYKVKPVNI